MNIFLLFLAGLPVIVSTAALEVGGSPELDSKLVDWMAKADWRFQQLEDVSHQLKAEIRQLRAEDERSKAENERLRAEIQQLRAEGEHLKAENVDIRAEDERQRAEIRVLKKNGQELKKLLLRLVQQGQSESSKVSVDREHLLKHDSHENRVSRGAFDRQKQNGNGEVREAVNNQKSVDENTVASHRVARTDDINPLEPVVTQMSQRLTEMTAEMQSLESAVREASSSVYVRWGKSTCPNSSSLVYSGFIGGGPYHHSGSAPNPLCLTSSPVLSDHNIPGEHSELFGAEYETFDSHYQKDPVCAVCRSPRPTTVMVPGTNVCMPGWTVEYSGFLMASHYAHPGSTDFICVDSAMENRVGGDTNQDGVLLHYTATVCGSLPCSPYVNNKVVTCVVCSQ